MSNYREFESNFFNLCKKLIINGNVVIDRRQIAEANLLKLAADFLKNDIEFQREAALFKNISDLYFCNYPEDKVEIKEILNNQWIISLPRFKDMLIIMLKQNNLHVK